MATPERPIPTEPVVRVAKALSALVATLPGIRHVQVSVNGSVTFHCETDEATHAFAAQLGLEMVEVANGESRWLMAKDASYAWIGTLPVSLYGPHRDLIPVLPIDEARVEAALAQADLVILKPTERKP